MNDLPIAVALAVICGMLVYMAWKLERPIVADKRFDSDRIGKGRGSRCIVAINACNKEEVL